MMGSIGWTGETAAAGERQPNREAGGGGGGGLSVLRMSPAEEAEFALSVLRERERYEATLSRIANKCNPVWLDTLDPYDQLTIQMVMNEFQTKDEEGESFNSAELEAFRAAVNSGYWDKCMENLRKEPYGSWNLAPGTSSGASGAAAATAHPSSSSKMPTKTATTNGPGAPGPGSRKPPSSDVLHAEQLLANLRYSAAPTAPAFSYSNMNQNLRPPTQSSYNHYYNGNTTTTTNNNHNYYNNYSADQAEAMWSHFQNWDWLDYDFSSGTTNTNTKPKQLEAPVPPLVNVVAVASLGVANLSGDENKIPSELMNTFTSDADLWKYHLDEDVEEKTKFWNETEVNKPAATNQLSPEPIEQTKLPEPEPIKLPEEIQVTKDDVVPPPRSFSCQLPVETSVKRVSEPKTEIQTASSIIVDDNNKDKKKIDLESYPPLSSSSATSLIAERDNAAKSAIAAAARNDRNSWKSLKKLVISTPCGSVPPFVGTAPENQAAEHFPELLPSKSATKICPDRVVRVSTSATRKTSDSNIGIIASNSPIVSTVSKKPANAKGAFVEVKRNEKLCVSSGAIPKIVKTPAAASTVASKEKVTSSENQNYYLDSKTKGCVYSNSLVKSFVPPAENSSDDEQPEEKWKNLVVNELTVWRWNPDLIPYPFPEDGGASPKADA